MPQGTVNVRAARARFERAAATIADASFVDREVESRMAERLDYIRGEPSRILDAGCGTGESVATLERRYPKAEIIAVDFAPALIARATARRGMLARARAFFGGGAARFACADMGRLPLAPGTVGLVWSNLALAWVSDPARVFAEWHRVLAVGGFVMFSTYGPDTLNELRGAFGAADRHGHVHDFIDMHDLGDMLVAAGFAEPVMDMERITLTYDSVSALVNDLRRSGSANAREDRARGLMSPRAWSRVAATYEGARRDGRLPATLEIVYGHAWKPAPRKLADGRAIINFDRPRKRDRRS